MPRPVTEPFAVGSDVRVREMLHGAEWASWDERVVSDDAAVGRLAAAHLLTLGLPHFGFFGTRRHFFSLPRQEGFTRAVDVLKDVVIWEGGTEPWWV